MYKISKIIAYLLGIVGAILWLVLVLATNVKDINNAPMHFMFVLAYILVAIAVLAVVISGAKNILSSPKALKKTAFYTGIFALVMILPHFFVSEKTDTENWVSASLISFYIFTAIAVGLLLVTGVKNALTR